MNNFELLDDLEACLQSIQSGRLDADLAIEYDRCPHCAVRMAVKSNNQYMCSRCGLLREDVEVIDMSSITSDMSYNSMSSGLRCVGTNAHRYQTILRSQSNNESSPETHVRNILFAHNYKIGKDGAIPKDVLLNVFEQFKHVRAEGSIYRGTILRAILAAMTYYECLRHKLLFKPSDIYEWFGVDSQTYSKGDKKVREMLDHGFLSEDIREINVEVNFLEACAIKLELDPDSIAFLIKLMDYTTEHKLLHPTAKSSTRALCVLHMYLVSTNYPMKPEAFNTMFKCNYGTIRTIALDLFHACDQLLPLFKEYNIPSSGLDTYRDKSNKVVRKRRAKHGRIEIVEDA